MLDRLLDDEPDQRRDPTAPRHDALARVVQSVRRDLEWLLGTRLTWVDEDLLSSEHLSRSIATYGLADFSHENLADSEARRRLQRNIERAIALFEPRLTRVAVTQDPAGSPRGTIRFRIDAILRVEPFREPVAFDTVVETSGGTRVQEA